MQSESLSRSLQNVSDRLFSLDYTIKKKGQVRQLVHCNNIHYTVCKIYNIDESGVKAQVLKMYLTAITVSINFIYRYNFKSIEINLFRHPRKILRSSTPLSKVLRRGLA
jgi:hypothetical protein